LRREQGSWPKGGDGMRRVLGCAALALTLAVLPVASAQDKKADADKSAPKDAKEAVHKLVVGGEITGKLIRWEGPDKYFTVKVELTYYVPDPGGIQRLADLQVKLARERNPVTALNLQQQIATTKTVQTKKESQDIEFQASPDLKARVLNPVVFDDKGKPKK